MARHAEQDDAAQRLRPAQPQGAHPGDARPASDTPEMIQRLAEAGADAFRINMSHGDHDDHARRIEAIRALESAISDGRRRSSPICRGRSSASAASTATRPSSRPARASSSIATRRSATRRARRFRTRRFSPRSSRDAAARRRRQARLPRRRGRARTDRGAASRSVARSPTIRASTSPTWCCRWRR